MKKLNLEGILGIQMLLADWVIQAWIEWFSGESFFFTITPYARVILTLIWTKLH